MQDRVERGAVGAYPGLDGRAPPAPGAAVTLRVSLGPTLIITWARTAPVPARSLPLTAIPQLAAVPTTAPPAAPPTMSMSRAPQ